MANASIGYILHSGKNSKAGYYLKAGFRDILPDSLFRHRLKREMDDCRRLYDETYIADRVNYYCRFNTHRDLGPYAQPIDMLQRGHHGSTYYYDSREILRWFNPNLHWNHIFGDVRDIPPYPSVVKSRSLANDTSAHGAEDNSNSVLLKLDKNRHYVFLRDSKPFEAKADRAIFRGYVGQRPNRSLFCHLFADNPRVDVANTLSAGSFLATEKIPHSGNAAPRLSLYEHLNYRYIMALEGNDVASNLRWVMSSNSLAVMPKPTCESWFMEERLQPGVHYIPVKDDFSDLETQLDYYSSHPKEAREVARNANRYVDQFRDLRRERYIGLRVMEKYFKLTNILILFFAFWAVSCGHKAEPVQFHRFEQFLFDNSGDAADFGTPLLNYHPDDPRFMAMLDGFVNDPVVRRVYTVTDSLYHDLSWLGQELGDAMARARELCPEVDYRNFYTLVTADFGNYPNRVFCDMNDMAIAIDCYTLGEADEMQKFGVPLYITRLCRRQYIAADVVAAAARAHIALPDGDLTFLDCAIAEGKTLYFLDQVLPSTPDTIKLRYTPDQLAWMESNLANVWGWYIQNNILYSTDRSQLRNLLDDAPKTNAFGDGSAPRTPSYIGWQIVKKYMKKSGASLSELLAETDSRKILETSGWRP